MSNAIKNNLPAGFSYLDDPRFIIEMAYLSSANFIGRPIAGYKTNVCILSDKAKTALIAVQDSLDNLQKNYTLKIFDSFRPTKAVADFKKWANVASDNKNQELYYPNLSKQDLFALEYLVPKSSHSRGSAVDLTIVTIDPNNNTKHSELDMGTIFDFFGEKSHTNSQLVSSTAQANRKLLQSLMEQHGFKNYPKEWWHYGLEYEPFPDTYFDFDVN